MQTAEPLVSIIIPTYDRAEMLQRAIDSVIGQSYRPLEIIVVDDASPVPVTVPNSSDMDMKVVRHSRRMGPGASRNTGLAHATGHFVTFLDDDDHFAPDRVRLAVEEISGEPMHACATSDNPHPYRGDLTHSLLHGAPPHVSQVLFVRAIVEQFDPVLRLAEDTEWWIRMAPQARFVWSDYVGVIRTIHHGERPGVEILTHAVCREEILRRHWAVLDSESRVRHLARVASLNLVADRRRRAIWYSLRGMAIRPTRRSAATILRALGLSRH